MRTLLVCLIFPGFFVISPMAFPSGALLGCEKESRKDRIQVCSTIIDAGQVEGKPVSQHNLSLAHFYRGNAHRDERQYRRALYDYEMAIALNPAITMAYYHMANIQWTLGYLEDAIHSYGQVIALNPRYPEAYFGRAETYYFLGRVDRATRDYAMALKLDPTLVDAWTAFRRLNIQPGPGTGD